MPFVSERIYKTIKWLWHKSKGIKLQSLLNFFVGISLVAVDLLFVAASKLVIDIATQTETTISLPYACVALAIIIILQILLGTTSRWIKATLSVKAINKLQHRIYQRLLITEWKCLQQFHSGDIVNRIQKDTTEISQFITDILPNFFAILIKFIGAFVFLFLMDKTLALVVVIILPIFIVISRIYISKLKELTHKAKNIESAIQSYLQESLQHTNVLKTLLCIDQATEKLFYQHKELQQTIYHKTFYSSTTATLLNLGFASGYFFTFCWGAYNLSQSLITYGTLMAFIQLVSQIQGPIRSLTGFIPIFINVSTSIERLEELESLELESYHHSPKNLNIPKGIKIENLTFSYNENSRNIFEKFNLDIKPQSKVAIIGETGSGKTTLIRIILSLVHPTDGKVSIYSDSFNSPLTAEQRKFIAYLPQGNTLLSGTIRENLLLAKPNATESEIENVLRMACAEFVFNLPLKLDTQCSEKGGGFSEGQAQRICLARTFLREAPIFILDEATSALDNETEQKIIENISTYLSNRTIIFVTHRNAVLKICDKVVKI